jgi:hypothetical protein
MEVRVMAKIMSLDGTVVCPECRGEKTMFGLACREGEPCKPFTSACRFCQGVGSVSPARAHVYERGERIRKERVQLGRTLHQQARLLGIDPEALNNLEFSKGSIEELDRLAKIVLDKGPV